MEFTIDTEYYDQDNVGEIALLQLCGPVDQKSVPIFEAEIHELFKKDICRFVLDLYNTKYLNSSGLGLLINIAHKVNVVGGGIRLVNVAEKFKVLFDMLGLDSSLPIFENRDAALKSFGSGNITQKSADKEDSEDENLEDHLESEDTNEEDTNQENTDLENKEPIQENQEDLIPDKAKDLIEKSSVLKKDDNSGDDNSEDNQKSDAVSLLTKKSLPNLKKNLLNKQEKSLKFTAIKTNKDNIYEPDRHVELEDDPQFELTESLSQLADNITDSGISIFNEKSTESPDISVSLIEKTFSEETFSEEKVIQTPIIKVTSEKQEISSRKQETSSEKQETESSFIHKKQAIEEKIVKKESDVKNSDDENPKREENITQAKSTQYIALPRQSQVSKIISFERNVQWYSVIEYYNQMRKNRSYPLSLHISRVDIVDNNRDDLAKLQNTNIMFVPRFPGCQVVPEKVLLDISSENAKAEFWITPFASGQIPGWVESLYKGKTSSFTKTPFKIKNNLLSGIFFILSLLCLFSYYWDYLDFLNDMLKEYRIWGHLISGLILLFTSFGFLRKNSPKLDIVEKLTRIKMQ